MFCSCCVLLLLLLVSSFGWVLFLLWCCCCFLRQLCARLPGCVPDKLCERAVICTQAHTHIHTVTTFPVVILFRFVFTKFSIFFFSCSPFFLVSSPPFSALNNGSQVPIIGQRRPCRINWISRSTLAFVRPHCCWWRRNADATRWYGSHCIWTDVLCAAKRIGMIISKCRKFHRRTHSYSKWVVAAMRQAISNTATLTQPPSHSHSHHSFQLTRLLPVRLSALFLPLSASRSFRFVSVGFDLDLVSLGLYRLAWACLGTARTFTRWLCVPVHLAFELERLPFDWTPAMFGLR